MIDLFIEWFFSRPKIERVLFIIDLVLLFALLCAVENLFVPDYSGSGVFV